MVAGTFETDVRGFRIVNGKPDLGADSVDTLEYIALREILKDDPDKPVRDVDLRDGHYIIPGDPAKAKTGYLESCLPSGRWHADGAALPVHQGPGQMARVTRTRRGPDRRGASPRASDRGERAGETDDLPDGRAAGKRCCQKHPAKGIYGAEFTANHNDKNRLGVCEVSYRPLPAEEPVKASYLFRQKKGSWVLERELAKTGRWISRKVSSRSSRR